MKKEIRVNKKELAIAKAMPVNEWFDIFHPSIAEVASASYANRIMRRFKCLFLSREDRLRYKVSAKDKKALIHIIENNLGDAGPEIEVVDNTNDNMWHMLLGTKSVGRNDTKKAPLKTNNEFESIYKRDEK